MTNVIFALLVLLLSISKIAAAEEGTTALSRVPATPVIVYNELPNNGDVLPQALVGDLYKIECEPDNWLTLTADSLPDESGQIAHLDLVANVFKKNGDLIGFADDNQACGVPLECGFACPRIEFRCPRSGNPTSTVFVALHDFGSAGQGCDRGGPYSMKVEAVNHRGALRPLVSVPSNPPHWAKKEGVVSAINSGVPSLFNRLPPPPPPPLSPSSTHPHPFKGRPVLP